MGRSMSGRKPDAKTLHIWNQLKHALLRVRVRERIVYALD